jgi:hypothetical protein
MNDKTKRKFTWNMNKNDTLSCLGTINNNMNDVTCMIVTSLAQLAH